jgi:hypothetical protein
VCFAHTDVKVGRLQPHCNLPIFYHLYQMSNIMDYLLENVIPGLRPYLDNLTNYPNRLYINKNNTMKNYWNIPLTISRNCDQKTITVLQTTPIPPQATCPTCLRTIPDNWMGLRHIAICTDHTHQGPFRMTDHNLWVHASKVKSRGRKCLTCGKDPKPNYYYCPSHTPNDPYDNC